MNKENFEISLSKEDVKRALALLINAKDMSVNDRKVLNIKYTTKKGFFITAIVSSNKTIKTE